jgi:hypothetical protein
VSNNNNYSLRNSQAAAFRALRDEQYTILNAPTGWGKSLTICALGARFLGASPENKILVVVPQRLISKGFVNECWITADGEAFHWKPTLNLCDDLPQKGEQLRVWLDAPTDSANRIAVTTAMNLTRALEGMADWQIVELFLDTQLVVDEGHHVQASQEETNRIGGIIAALLAAKEPNSRLLLGTAYFFRGDRLPILHEEDEGRFKRHAVPLDQYWKELSHLKAYFYDSVCYKGTVWKELDELLKRDAASPTLFFCPRANGHLAIGGKDQFVDTLVEHLTQHIPGARLWQCDQEPEGTAVIVDLVSLCDRPDKIRFIMEHGERIIAVLACGMMKEGADWVTCSRVIDFQPSMSDQDRNQRFGRLLRDDPSKSSVRYFSFFPYLATMPEPAQRLEISRLFAHFHASLLFDNALMPVRVPTGKEDVQRKTYAPLVDVLGQYDPQTQQQILEKCSETLLGLAGMSDQPLEADAAHEALDGLLKDTFFVPNHQRSPLIKQITLLFRRRNYGVHVDDLIKAGFDKVWSNDVLAPLMAYTAGACGAQTFAELHRCINIAGLWDDNFGELQKLTERPRSTHPLYSWFRLQIQSRWQLPPDRVAKLESIPWWSWDAIKNFDETWLTNFDGCRKLDTPPHSDSLLGRWITGQRWRFNNGRISEEQIKLCESIPWWRWQGRPIKDFATRYAECLASEVSPVHGSSLWAWWKFQKSRIKKGELGQEQKSLLEAIPWWFYKPQKTFEETLAEVQKLDQPPTPKKDDALYRWAKKFCWLYSKGKLSAEQIAQLESIPWWTWGRANRLFAETVAECLAEETAPEEGSPLYRWCSQQKLKYKRGKLSAEQIAKLEAIPWWSWASHSTFEERYAECSALDELPDYHTSLYRWCSQQKLKYKRGKLSAEQIAKLESIPWWKWGRSPALSSV